MFVSVVVGRRECVCAKQKPPKKTDVVVYVCVVVGVGAGSAWVRICP